MSDETSIAVPKTPMLRRLLNIASTVCLVLCVALMGLWVRSYWWLDHVNKRDFGVTSATGWVTVRWDGDPQSFHQLTFQSTSVEEMKKIMGRPMTPGETMRVSMRKFGFVEGAIQLPYWFLTLLISPFAIFAAASWRKWRFTLRTLFIATTFLAVVLGMIAWLDRAWIGK